MNIFHSVSSFTLTCLLLSVANPSLAATFTRFATGLNNARGLTFGPDGELYVAIAGTGGGPTSPNSIPSPNVPGLDLYLGNTGAISKVSADGTVTPVVTGLSSLALADGSNAVGPQDIAFDASGTPYILYGSVADPAQRDRTLNALAGSPYSENDVLGTSELGSLYQANFQTGQLTQLADLARYELQNNPTGGDIDSNPNSLAIDGDTIYITDSGANNLFAYSRRENQLQLNTTFDPEIVALDSLKFPQGLGPPPAAPNDPTQAPETEDPLFPLQYVPTGVAVGADGNLYVAEFGGFPFPDGRSEITQIDGNGQQTTFADGLIQLTDIAFAPSGKAYATVLATESLALGGDRGKVVEIGTDGKVTTILDGNQVDGVELLVNLTVATDGLVYVAGRGNGPESTIFQIDPDGDAVDIPEPNSASGVLILGLLGGVSFGVKSARKRLLERGEGISL
ncbi:ScyD/ScyE family protein [Capilliphycus salinus ALCB114379]|uniref:ScyD/ScyE family protein n=1 Tax=Capilliphycus salinus TaxID=2768948 RepID=UPI0039A44346